MWKFPRFTGQIQSKIQQKTGTKYIIYSKDYIIMIKKKFFLNGITDAELKIPVAVFLFFFQARI